jgi:hypothetical protein
MEIIPFTIVPVLLGAGALALFICSLIDTRLMDMSRGFRVSLLFIVLAAGLVASYGPTGASIDDEYLVDYGTLADWQARSQKFEKQLHDANVDRGGLRGQVQKLENRLKGISVPKPTKVTVYDAKVTPPDSFPVFVSIDARGRMDLDRLVRIEGDSRLPVDFHHRARRRPRSPSVRPGVEGHPPVVAIVVIGVALALLTLAELLCAGLTKLCDLAFGDM